MLRGRCLGQLTCRNFSKTNGAKAVKTISEITEMTGAPSRGRRSFVKLLGGGLLGATAMAAGVDGIARAQAKEDEEFPPLWSSALVWIGNSPADQHPSPVIKCPFFSENGRFANAFHTLDLANLRMTGRVTGSIIHQNDVIYPDFSPSIAGAVTQGTDGKQYFLVGGEAALASGTGIFKDVSNVIVRCKYKVKVDQQGDILLIACVDCVAVLVRRSQSKA
jgi:hypothetical protein